MFLVLVGGIKDFVEVPLLCDLMWYTVEQTSSTLIGASLTFSFFISHEELNREAISVMIHIEENSVPT